MKTILSRKSFAYFLLCFLAIFFCFGGVKVTAKAEEEKEYNGAYILAGVPDAEGAGVSVLFLSQGNGVTVEFDLLKGVENGYFGIVYGTGNQLVELTEGYMGVSRTGATMVQGLQKPEDTFRFLSGYRYKIEAKKGAITISRKEYGGYQTVGYEEIYSTKLKESKPSIGIFVKSTDTESGYVLLDNVTITTAEGKVTENSFNDFYAPIEGAVGTTSNDSSYSSLYRGARYTVVFTDGNGKVVKVVETVEYNYAVCEDVPAVEGKVLKGWSDDVKKVLKDMVVTPVYGEPEPEKQPDKKPEKKGCSSVSGMGVFAVIAATGLVFLKKREDRV